MRILLPACFLLFSCAAAPENVAGNSAETLSVSKLPSFSLSLAMGGSFEQTALLGKPALVNFWHPR